MTRFIITFLIIIFILPATAQSIDGRAVENFFKAPGTPVNPMVQVAWNRYYTSEGMLDIYRRMVRAYPELVKLESIGKSYQGRDIWLLTVTNHKNKSHSEKPGFWIDGAIHSNEIQGSEIALYTAWYLTENYGKNAFITELVDDKVFYILPISSPDGREMFINQPGTGSSSRSGAIPLDDDGDGLAGEDAFDDLNGDGHITMMRRANPMEEWRTDADDPRHMVRARPGEFGKWEMLGMEGIDRDGDGFVNEDRPDGFYDPNRDWGWNWQPDYIQRGAFRYPFSLPESRAVRDFVMAHPNIAGAQSYHNTGGMLLRGPGVEEDAKFYLPEDVRVYDFIGELGEKLIPGYDYFVVYKDLYTVYGGQVDWFHLKRGIFTFTNELWTSYYYFHQKPDGWFGSQQTAMEFDKLLLFGDAFVPWQDFEHPQFGKIQIGGLKKNFGRINPGFLLEQEAHRNMAFTLHHAWHTPKLEIVEFTSCDMGGGLREVTAVIANTRMIPTHAGIDLRYKIERPNLVSLQGGKVLAGMIVKNRDLNVVEEQRNQPEVLKVDNIPGMSTVTLRWIVEGGRKLTLTVDSVKGGKLSKEL